MKIVGNDFQREAIQRLITSKQLPHALLLSGPAGIGKKTFALDVAKKILCSESTDKNPDCDCQACKIFKKANHPDFFLVDCLNDETSNIKSIRELLNKLSLAPFLGHHRVVVFDNVEHLGLASANVLLKSLEEPRRHTYFILVSANSSRLPLAVTSRCQIWNFSPLSSDEILQAIQINPILASKEVVELIKKIPQETLNILCNGSLEKIIKIEDLQEIWADLESSIEDVILGKLNTAISLAQSLASNKATLRQSLHLLQGILRFRMLKSSIPEQKKLFATSLHNLLLAENLILERNISGNYALTEVFTRLAGYIPQQSFTAPEDSATLHGFLA
jgi:DNA polymerase III gamma/tau subunit